MRGLRILMLILLTAVFAAGGPLRALPVHADGVPSCHETADTMADMAHDKAPAHKSRPDAVSLSCCVGCLPAATRDASSASAPGAVVRIAFAPVSQALDGLSLAPEHEPPRPLA
jgi:hypothetical protein